MIKLSVVIPCYNMSEYIVEAINSVKQYKSQQSIEIIIVNDGSNDGITKPLLDSIALENLKIIHQENKGLSNARNTGVKEARGDYILFLDADNKIRPPYIDHGIGILSSKVDVAVVYGDVQKFGLENFACQVGDFDITKLLVKNYIDACAVVRKSAWKTIQGFDEHMLKGYEDWDFFMRLYFKGWKFTYVDEILFDYRVRENSMLANSNKMRESLLSYIFNKPEYEQATKIRKELLKRIELSETLESIKNRKISGFALRLEKWLKTMFHMKSDDL